MMIDNLQIIHEELYKPLFDFTVGFCRDADLAKHVVADVFVSLVEREELPVDLRGWLFLTAKHRVIDYYYERKRLDPIEDEWNKPASSDLRPVEQEVIEKIALEEQRLVELQVLSLIEQLNPRRRRALHLRMVEERSTLETAEAMGLSEGAAKAALHQAFLQIRKGLGIQVVRSTNCLYGRCRKERVPDQSYCENHLRIMTTAAVRRYHRRKRGWN